MKQMNFENKTDGLTFFELRVIEQFCELFEKIETETPCNVPNGYIGDALAAIPAEFVNVEQLEHFALDSVATNDTSWHIVVSDLGIGLVTRSNATWLMELLPIAYWPEAYLLCRTTERLRWFHDTTKHKSNFVNFFRDLILGAMQVNTYNYNSDKKFPTNFRRFDKIEFHYTVISDDIGEDFDDILDWLSSNPDSEFWHGIMQFRVCGTFSPVAVCRINNTVVVNSVPIEHRAWAITWAALQNIHRADTEELFLRRGIRIVNN